MDAEGNLSPVCPNLKWTGGGGQWKHYSLKTELRFRFLFETIDVFTNIKIMEQITDDLLSGISDPLTKEIELFLLNNISEKDTQVKIIELLNKAFKEGGQTALDYYEQAKENFKSQATVFQKEFHNKLFDGQDQHIPE